MDGVSTKWDSANETGTDSLECHRGDAGRAGAQTNTQKMSTTGRMNKDEGKTV